MQLRERIYLVLKPWSGKKYSRLYDIAMLAAIAMGIFPLMFRKHFEVFWYFNLISGLCFLVDYLLRWITADIDAGNKGKWTSFIWYPFTPMAIIDLLSILPLFHLLNPTFKVARLTRLLMTLRVFKVIRYFEPLEIVLGVIRSQRKILLTVLSLSIFYIFITALIMFNAEEDINPETGKYLFDTFFEAFYWAACTLTTVGYGDLYPISSIGRVISIISSMVGIAIIALPSGIITAGYMEELRCRREKKSHSEKSGG